MSVAADVAATLVVLACRVLLGVVVSLGVIAAAPVAVGMTSTVVMSDSMSPGIRAGDVVVVRPMAARGAHIGQVALVDDPSTPGRLRLHRIVGYEGAQLVLKGDANAQRDASTIVPQAFHGVAFLRVPLVGLPMLWLRDGRPALALLAAGLLCASALAVALLDRGSGRTTIRILRRSARALRRRRAAVAAVVVVVLAGTGLRAPIDLGPASWAAFSATTKSPSDSVATGTWCPALPKPIVTMSSGASAATLPQIAYGFAAAGQAEPNIGTLGSGYGAKLSDAALRTAGNCTPGSSPSVTFKGGESVVSTSPYPAGATGTQSLWFNATTAAGVLGDLGASTASSASADRQLYFTSGGGLAFVVRNGGTPVSCVVTTSVTLGAWHFAAVVYDGTAKTFTVYYDGQSTSCSMTFTTTPSGNLYARLGSDATFTTNASSGSYVGSIDEYYSWGGTMTGSGVATVYAGGH